MNDDNLKKMLQETVKEELRPIKDPVEMTKKRVETLDLLVGVSANNVRLVKEQQSLMNEKMDKLIESVDANSASIVSMEATLEGYADAYKLNRDGLLKHEVRLQRIESEVGIEAPPELTVNE